MSGCMQALQRKDKGRKGGGCAFCGVKMALQPIVDVLHLVHGPASCFGHAQESRPTATSGSTLYQLNVSTDLGEMNVVMGGEDRLFKAIVYLADCYKPTAIFVYQTCVPSMIGDRLSEVCAAGADATGCPVVAVDIPGIVGGKNFGTQVAGDILLENVIGTKEPDFMTDADVNLIGEYNVAGEVAGIRTLLSKLGIRVLASIPGDGRFEEIAAAHRAKATISLCSRSFDGLAEKMRERYGIPFIKGSFYGCAAVSSTLLDISYLLAQNGGPSDLPYRALQLISQEEKRLETTLRGYRQRLSGKRALLGCGGVKSWSLASALRHIGLDVVGTSISKGSADDRAKAAAAVGRCRLVTGLPDDLGELAGVDVILSGGMRRFAALKAGIAWVDVNHERRISLCGYDGMLRLAAAVDNALNHPVWAQLQRDAPGDRCKRDVDSPHERRRA